MIYFIYLIYYISILLYIWYYFYYLFCVYMHAFNFSPNLTDFIYLSNYMLAFNIYRYVYTLYFVSAILSSNYTHLTRLTRLLTHIYTHLDARQMLALASRLCIVRVRTHTYAASAIAHSLHTAICFLSLLLTPLVTRVSRVSRACAYHAHVSCLAPRASHLSLLFPFREL